jgi:peptidase C25-like protein
LLMTAKRIFVNRKKLFLAFVKSTLAFVFCCLVNSSASAQSYPAAWPANGSWTPYTMLNSATKDLRTDAGDQTDGGTGVNPDSADTYDDGTRNNAGTLPTTYYYYDSANQVLFFRMRILGDPRQGSAFSNGTWNAILDTDGDGFKEFFVEVNGNNDPDFIYVYYGNSDRQDIPNGATCAVDGQRVWSQQITLGTHARVSTANAGYFMEFQVPLSAFLDCSNLQLISPTTPMLLVYTTSQTTQNPTQKDLVGSGDYEMDNLKRLPGGDRISLTGGISQPPFIPSVTRVCGAGVNSNPVTLTASTLDALTTTGSGAAAVVVDTIATVQFSYRKDGDSSWTQIALVNTPVAGTVNKWTTTWTTSSLPAGNYTIRVDVTDDQGNVSTDVTLRIDISNCSTPTAIELSSFTAAGQDGQVLLRWQTGYEADNLGFNIYREEDGKQIRITPQIIAGSALLAGPRTVLTAGRSYMWRDRSPSSKSARYWLEEIDLDGTATWHGPASVNGFDAELASSPGENAPLLSEIVSIQSEMFTTLPVEPVAKLSRPTEALLSVQAAAVSQQAVKLRVNRAGWYRLTQQELAASGFGAGTDTQLLQLFADGRELPILVTTDNSDPKGSSIAIEFYGTGPDSQYSNDRAYWLVMGSRPGLRLTTTKGSTMYSAVPSFAHTVERKDRTLYFSSLLNGDAENFFGAVVSPAGVDQSLYIKSVDLSGDHQAVLTVRLQGVTNSPHRVMVLLNDVPLGAMSFTGQANAAQAFGLSHAILREGANLIRLAAQAGSSDVSLIDSVRLTYQRTYVADDNFLQFTAAGGQQVTVAGFNSPAIKVVDISDPRSPLGVSAVVRADKGGYSVTASTPGSGERTLIAFAESAVKRVPMVAGDVPSKWRTPANGADLVIITRRELSNSLARLIALRQRQGLKVATVDIEDVYDEFSFGQKTPQAVKSFLAYAKTTWKVAPRFVLLAGDASLDPKNYLGQGDYDLVPTRLIDTVYMETASDDWFADFNGDAVAELAVGRLPVRNASEAESIVAKILTYEQTSSSEEALFVADRNDGFDFEGANHQLRALLPAGMRAQEIKRGQMDGGTAKSILLSAINNGPKMITYSGHGSVGLWRGNLLMTSDIDSLTNSERLPVFLMMTCLNGYFLDPSVDGLAEALMKARRGGAVAVWASSGMTFADGQVTMSRHLYNQLFSAPDLRPKTMGEAVNRAKAAVSDMDIRRTWILFGDPTMTTR